MIIKCLVLKYQWVLADLYVVNDSTGLPLANREITLFYWYDGIIGETTGEELSFWKTDNNGYLKVEHKVTWRMDGFEFGTEISGSKKNDAKILKIYPK